MYGYPSGQHGSDPANPNSNEVASDFIRLRSEATWCVFDHANVQGMDHPDSSKLRATGSPSLVADQTGVEYVADDAMASLIQPLPCQTGFASALQDPFQPWDGAVDLETPSLESTTAIDFIWPQIIANSTPASGTPDLSPPMFVQPPLMRDASFPSHLSRQTTSTDSITSGLPRRSESTSYSASSQPSSKRARSSLTQQSSIEEDLPTTTANSSTPKRTTRSRRANSTSATPSQPQDEDADADGEAEEQPDNEEDQEKLRMYRERNRIAAAKTRRKKKSSAKELEHRAQDVMMRNEQLKQEERALRDALSTLRFSALAHDSSNVGCQCTDIHMYNQRRAMEMAQGLSTTATTTTNATTTGTRILRPQ